MLSATRAVACSVEGCDGPARAKGLCHGHYKRHRLGKPLDTPMFRRGVHEHCVAPECDGQIVARHMCAKHYQSTAVWGITWDERQAILAAQEGGCGICGTTTPDAARDWANDHDHLCCPGATGCRVCLRGLLCHPCNTKLGYVERWDGKPVTQRQRDYCTDPPAQQVLRGATC